MIGQEHHKHVWIEALASGRMPHAWLLGGPKGIGKAGFAQRAARFLMTDGDRRAVEQSKSGADRTLSVDAAHPALALIQNGSHPDFIWLKREVPEAKRPKDGGAGKAEDIARNITIAQVRALMNRLRMRPSDSRWRCVIIDSIDDLERSAVNALLKTLEEPPDNTVFLLVSHQPGALLPTIRSRCRMLRFSRLDRIAMRRVLNEAVPDLSADDQDMLLSFADGSPGRAIQFANAELAAIAMPLAAIAQSGDRDNKHRVELARVVAGTGSAGRIEIMLIHANSIACEKALTSPGRAAIAALDARSRIAEAGRMALSGSEDPAMVAFVVADALASLNQ